MGWFEVDKKGLGKLLEKRGKALVIIELLQNCWDTNAKTVEVILRPVGGKSLAYLKVTDDDPDGFKDLTHAYTLFAESEKKDDPTKRGRFNLGEKLVLSLCKWAKIGSTKGEYTFSHEGQERTHNWKGTEKGSYFEAEIKVTRKEIDEIMQKISELIPPHHITTVVNGVALLHRTPIHTFEASLPTEVADEEGVLRKTTRKTTVEIYEPRTCLYGGETASIYELGIPVVDTGDKYHVNICQKVPLNFNRDNVTPSYLRTLRTLVFNEMHNHIEKEEANDSWVREATSDERCTTEAIQTAVTHRFGEKSVAFDPGDPEANRMAVSVGYTVIPGRSMNKGEWANVRRAQEEGIKLALPSGKVTPTPKPFSTEGRPLKTLPEEKYTPEIKKFIKYAQWLSEKLLGIMVFVTIANDRDWGFTACYGEAHLTVNLQRVGKPWFEHIGSITMNRLLIHEFAHHKVSDHLSHEFHEETCWLGAKLAAVAAKHPSKFKELEC